VTITVKTLTDEELILPGRSGCAGCAGVIVARLALKVLGRETVMVSATGCVISNFSHAGAPKVPFMHSLFPGAGSLIAGIDAGLTALGKREGVKLIAMAGDGGTADIGLQALSGAMERGHQFLYICYDNEGYMNTGGQRSGTTSYLARTATTPVGETSRGVLRPNRTRKDMVQIAAAHGIPYVATASLAYPQDLLRKIETGAQAPGPAYIHVLTPCNYRWGFPEDKSIEVSKMAVMTRVFPLLEIKEGWDYKIAMRGRPKRDVREYLSMQNRFRHLDNADIETIQSDVDRKWERLTTLEKLSGERTA
jgi:pyruvate ferredoxin oxidoreductase beta subunit